MKTGDWIALAGLGISAIGNIAFVWWITQQNKTIASYKEQAAAHGVILVNPR